MVTCSLNERVRACLPCTVQQARRVPVRLFRTRACSLNGYLRARRTDSHEGVLTERVRAGSGPSRHGHGPGHANSPARPAPVKS